MTNDKTIEDVQPTLYRPEQFIVCVMLVMLQKQKETGRDDILVHLSNCGNGKLPYTEFGFREKNGQWISLGAYCNDKPWVTPRKLRELSWSNVFYDYTAVAKIRGTLNKKRRAA